MIGYITRETDLFLLSKAVMATKKNKKSVVDCQS